MGTPPLGAFLANRFGLVDIIGNGWEWTATECYVHPRLNKPPNACVHHEARESWHRPNLKGWFVFCAPRDTATGTNPLRGSRGQRIPRPPISHIGFCCVADLGFGLTGTADSRQRTLRFRRQNRKRVASGNRSRHPRSGQISGASSR